MCNWISVLFQWKIDYDDDGDDHDDDDHDDEDVELVFISVFIIMNG